MELHTIHYIYVVQLTSYMNNFKSMWQSYTSNIFRDLIKYKNNFKIMNFKKGVRINHCYYRLIF